MNPTLNPKPWGSICGGRGRCRLGPGGRGLGRHGRRGA